MRLFLSVMTAATVAGCTPVTMAGFDDVAPEAERLAMTGVPAFMNGDFRMGASRGHVARRASTATEERGSLTPDWVPNQIAERGSGRLSFDLSGPEVGGRLEGECRYDRLDAGLKLGDDRVTQTVTAAVRPLLLACAYRLDGRDVGGMELRGAPPGAPTPLVERAGEVRVDGVALAVRSDHAMTGVAGPSTTPVGYLVEEGGRPVAALETVGSGTRRLMLPADPARRRAALAALVTLGLFWDPDDAI